MPASEGSAPQSDGRDHHGYAGNLMGPGMNRPARGQNFMMNETVLAVASGKLGIPEQDLKNALSSTTNTTTGRQDISAASVQLGITRQQLMDALGFPSGGFRGPGNVSVGDASGQ